jgi:hypothetical protein
MRTLSIATAIALGSTLLYAEDFSLTQNGFGPITVHTAVTYEGKGERLAATAINDSGQAIPYVKLCVTAETKGCLFEMWNTEVWEPGKTLSWDVTAARHVPNLSHQVKIEALNIPPKPPQVATIQAEVPKAPPENRPAPAPVPVRPAPEALTNETVLKLSKAGLGDEVILGMVNSQPGKYSLDADSVIALKQGGVSSPVIAAMMASRGAPPTGGPSFSLSAAPNVAASSEPLVLHDSTPVRMRLSRNLSSADAKTGDTIDFEVLDDVTVGDLVVIPRGAVAIGTVTDAEKKKRMARGGKLDVTIDYVRLITGDKVALRGVKETKGGGHTGAMTGAIVATAIVVWPAAPFFLFMHGKDTVIPKGTEITAYVDGEIKIDARAFHK